MGKALAKAGAVIAGAALIATGLGAVAGAGLLGSAASALATGAGTWELFGLSIATVGQIGAGLSLAGSLVTKRPDVQTGGSPTQQAYDPQAGIPYPMGRTAVAGRIIYGTTAPENNKYRLLYSILSGAGPIDGIEGFFANNEAVNFTADGGEGASGKYLNRMWQVRRLGAPGDTAMRFTATGSKDTPANHGGNPPEWTTAHLVSGYAAAVTACEYDTKVFSGDVSPLWVLRGVKVYDPRQDSTYPGGSGACRAGDETTYVYSENPWLHALTWALGRYQNGKRVLGFGFKPSAIIVSQFVEAANVADANGWKIGGVIYSTDDKLSAMQAMAQAGGGYCVPMGAQIGCVVNTPRVSIGTVSSSDIIGESSAAGTKGRRDRINRIIPRYRSEAHNWEVVAAAPIEVAEHITFDGGSRTREVDYTLVQNVIQAAQLARYDIENSREFEPVVLTVGPGFLGYRAGDCLTANVPELGLSNQALIVTRRTFDPKSGAVTLECRSETAAKHAYCLGQSTTPPPTPSLTAPTFAPVAPDPANWSATGGVLASASGSLPVIVIRGVLDYVQAISVIVDYRQVLTTAPTATYGDWASQEFPASSLATAGADPTITIQLTGLVPGASYQVRVRYRTVRQVTDPTISTGLGTVVVGGVTTPTTAPDTTPPAAPSGLGYDAALGTLFLRWTDPPDADLDKIEVWESATNDRSAAVKVATVAGYPGGKNGWTRSGLNSGVTRYYALRAIDSSGNLSGWYPSSATGMFAAATASLKIADFPADLEPVGAVATLPDPTGYAGSKTIRNAADGKLYRYVGGAWVTSVAAGDISGTIGNSQISSIAAAKLTGQIVDTQIGNGAIKTPQLDAGAVTSAKVAAYTLTANNVAANSMTADRMVLGDLSSAYIAANGIQAINLAANSVTGAKVVAGTLTADRILTNEIDTQYIKNGALSNAGLLDITGDVLVGPSPYTNIGGGGLSIPIRGDFSSAYTTVLMMLYARAENRDMTNQVGFWVDVILSGVVSATLGGDGVLLEPGNPAFVCLPFWFRTNTPGTVNVAVGAWANLTGPASMLYRTRIKLVPLAIYKS